MRDQTPAQSSPQDRREALVEWMLERLPAVGFCCSWWRSRADGHDRFPPCETVNQARHVADALLASQELRDLVADEVERIARSVNPWAELPDVPVRDFLLGQARAIRSGERGIGS